MSRGRMVGPGQSRLTPEMIERREVSCSGVRPVRMIAFHASTYSLLYVCPCPGGTPVANGRSPVICQNVRNGTQMFCFSTSLPGGSLVQSGLLSMRLQSHQTMGSEA